MEAVIKSVSNMARTAAELGLALIVVGLVIDIVFPGTTGIAANVGALATSISEKGLAGLIALGLFFVIYTRGQNTAPSSPPPPSPGPYGD